MVKANSLEEIVVGCPNNQVIYDNLVKAWVVVNNPKYEKILCSISGGSDSDIMLDIIWRCDKDNKVDYVWFDTGLEYQATKDHLKYLEEKYGIEIIREKAIKPIPIACRDYGQPFMSKYISDMIQRLQRHDFQWEDDTLDNLIKKYKGCCGALKWWCNENGNDSSFNINRKRYLKDFMIKMPPTYRVSNKCCDYAKKKVSNNFIKHNNYDLNIVGVRKSEGGIRSTSYKNCFDEKNDSYDSYRPLFWYKNEDKVDYEKAYGVIHSKCYTEYGLERTGCAGCPYGKNVEHELKVIEKYEPKLYKAVNNIFKDSYKYRREYEKFKKEMSQKRE